MAVLLSVLLEDVLLGILRDHVMALPWLRTGPGERRPGLAAWLGAAESIAMSGV